MTVKTMKEIEIRNRQNIEEWTNEKKGKAA